MVWDPAGGEQASVSNLPGDIQQTYYGSYTGTVQGGTSWFGPFSHSDHRWKFRMICGKRPCEGNNYANANHLDPVLMGGPMVGIRWVPTASVTVQRVEVYTGELAAPNAISIWSTDGGLPPKPLAPIAYSNNFTTTVAKGWQGANLLSPVSVTAGNEYWVVWDSGRRRAVPGDRGRWRHPADVLGDLQRQRHGRGVVVRTVLLPRPALEVPHVLYRPARQLRTGLLHPGQLL